jgi:hypothetical protein
MEPAGGHESSGPPELDGSISPLQQDASTSQPLEPSVRRPLSSSHLLCFHTGRHPRALHEASPVLRHERIGDLAVFAERARRTPHEQPATSAATIAAKRRPTRADCSFSISSLLPVELF